MNKIFKTSKTTILVIALLFFGTIGYAQLPPGFGDDVNDEPLPISSLVALGLVAGAAFGIKKLK